MAKEKRKSKGFSLFAPLVGTTIMLAAIFMTVSMLQNDVRLSRGIVSSFQSSIYASQAAIVRAKARVGVRIGMEEGIDKLFSDDGFSSRAIGAMQCNDKIECHGVFKGKINELLFLGNIMTKSLTDNIADNIAQMTNLELESRETVNADAIKAKIDKSVKRAVLEGLFDFSINKEGNLNVVVNDSVLGQYEKDISITFIDPRMRGDKIQISLIPKGFTYPGEKKFGPRAQDSLNDSINSVLDDFETIKNAFFAQATVPTSLNLNHSVRKYIYNTCVGAYTSTGTFVSNSSKGIGTCKVTANGEAGYGLYVEIEEKYKGVPFVFIFQTDNSATTEIPDNFSDFIDNSVVNKIVANGSITGTAGFPYTVINQVQAQQEEQTETQDQGTTEDSDTESP